MLQVAKVLDAGVTGQEADAHAGSSSDQPGWLAGTLYYFCLVAVGASVYADCLASAHVQWLLQQMLGDFDEMPSLILIFVNALVHHSDKRCC